MQFLENEAVDLVKELVDYHSHKVDPRNITISTTFFLTLVQEVNLRNTPFTRMYLVMTQYTTEKTKAQSSGPNISQFLETPQIQNL